MRNVPAIQAFKQALELEEGLQRAKDGLSRAQKLQKQSEQRDYYKILGVKRYQPHSMSCVSHSNDSGLSLLWLAPRVIHGFCCF